MFDWASYASEIYVYIYAKTCQPAQALPKLNEDILTHFSVPISKIWLLFGNELP